MNKNQNHSTILSWLENKFSQKSNGVIVENDCFASFDIIQKFIEKYDRTFETPIIYYEAFPEESAAEFFSTLHDELLDKLGNSKINNNQPLSAIIQASALKMVIIDKSHLHPLNTLNSIVDFCVQCNVALVLIGSGNKMEIAQILNHPIISTWSQFNPCDQIDSLQNIVSQG